ncbi:uncharacterized protein [Lolium perenne]|uniref:uncharacterized protein isoform X2 n=1 Tax=Lolium perenne TaxID=4522 RepID=UPI003A9974AE
MVAEAWMLQMAPRRSSKWPLHLPSSDPRMGVKHQCKPIIEVAMATEASLHLISRLCWRLLSFDRVLVVYRGCAHGRRLSWCVARCICNGYSGSDLLFMPQWGASGVAARWLIQQWRDCIVQSFSLGSPMRSPVVQICLASTFISFSSRPRNLVDLFVCCLLLRDIYCCLFCSRNRGKSWSEQRMAVADGVDGHDVVLGQRIRGRGENGERCSRSGR